MRSRASSTKFMGGELGGDDAGARLCASSEGFVFDDAVDEREQREVAAHAHAGPGVHLGADLAHDDVAGDDALAAENLHATALAAAVTAVLAASLTFLV